MTQENKHTPAPWIWEGDDLKPVFEVDMVQGCGVLHFKNEHDKALIQAAPDLLEALESALDCPDMYDYVQWLTEVAEPAINKARGN